MEVSKLKVDKKSMLLYVVTDRTWLGENTLKSQVEASIKAGATFIQLREKEMTTQDFINEAIDIKTITDQYQIPFVINDNVEVAMAVNADGVHVGQGDMEVSLVRNIIGENKILGVSARTVEQAVKAEQMGADYIGIGAVFATSTKLDANIVSFETVKEMCTKVSIPVVAIGGINEENILQLKGLGLDGAAVVSAIFSKSDIGAATQNLRELSKKMVRI